MKDLALRLFMRLSVPVRRRLIWIAKNKYTVGVSAIVLDDEGYVLLLRHRWREIADWEIPGGFVERGEALEDALRRELYEETGLHIAVQRLVSVAVPKPLHVDVRYLARAVGGHLAIDAQELVDARFFDPDELPFVLSADYRALVERALNESVSTGG